MSSRALKKLHGKDDLAIIEKSLTSTKARKTNSGANSSEDEDRSEEEFVSTPKKQNLFSLVLEDEELSSGNDETVQEIIPNASKSTKKKKNKKKNKRNKKLVEEDIDELLASTGSLPPTLTTAISRAGDSFDPLSIQLKNLNPENEMKKKFGQKVVGENSRRRQTHKTYKKTVHLVTPDPGWHPVTKTGFEMNLVGREGECHVFQIEHKSEYQKIQNKFWDAVDSMAPENLMAVLQLHAYHIDTLLQLSEVCRMSEDPQMAAELIERALYAFESSFHPLFNMTTGKCLLKYKVWENRGFFLALFRHLINVGNRGCYKTSLEYCKLLLGLDPEADPLCALLFIDFYSLRSDEYTYLIQLYTLWKDSRNLRILPNFAFSVPLAMFHTSQPDTPRRTGADEMLQESLMMFPGLLQPLLEECGVNTEADKSINKHFGEHKQQRQPASLRQLVHLYVGRTGSCWKAPECIEWLEANVKKCCEIGESNPERFSQLTSRGYSIYRGVAPPNVCRHLLMSDNKKAIADLPQEVTSSSILSYDPLPPADTVRSYDRQSNRVRAVSNQGFLSAFINSLRPNFDVNALMAEDEEAELDGAAGGAGNLRRAGAGLINAVRELLNNIELVGPERDDEDAQLPPNDEWD